MGGCELKSGLKFFMAFLVPLRAVVMAQIMNIIVFWDLMPCGLIFNNISEECIVSVFRIETSPMFLIWL
jgi:hypothetical protein